MIAPSIGSRLLIVNADDFGLTLGVSRAVIAAHRHGIVSSTSVLAVGPAFEQSVPMLRHEGTIGVGAHLALVGEDPPLLSAREIPTLVDRRGQMPTSWRQLIPRVATGRIDADDIRRELGAQLERLTLAGLRLTHVDTHQHVHLWPSIRDVVLDLAEAAGIGGVRVIRSRRRHPVGLAVRRLGALLEARARHRGFVLPAAAAGLDEAGDLTTERLCTVVDRLGAGGAPSAELATHPGERDDADLARYRWGFRWGDELDALCDQRARRSVERSGFVLGTYDDLHRA